MIFVADEGIDCEIVAELRKEGYEVLYVAEMSPSVSDADVLKLSRQKNAILITPDKDFGELVFRQAQVHAGVLLLRLSGLRVEHKAALVITVLQRYGSKLARTFSVISPGLFRSRPEKPLI